jgi:hypothetical protein
MKSSNVTKSILVAALLIILLSGTGVLGFPDHQNQSPGELQFKAPSEWVVEVPSSRMRVAQYKLPANTGDGEDASLVLYFFGSNSGGSVQSNLDRWISQIEQPDGSSSAGKAKTETLDVNKLKITTIDLSGTYVAETAPGSGTKYNKPAYRLRAAVIETPKGAYYIKFVGPAKTIERWDKSFVSYLKSFEFK